MKIVYRITEQDFMEGYELFVANMKWFRRLSRRVMPWEGGVALIVGITALAVTQDRVLPTILCLVGAYLLYCGFALRRYFRQLYRKDHRLHEEITADISDEGVHVVTPTSDSQLKWGAIIRYLESDKIFMFFYSEWTFSVVPKRAFASEELDPLRDLLRHKILPPK